VAAAERVACALTDRRWGLQEAQMRGAELRRLALRMERIAEAEKARVEPAA
jgi:hypothetical protein